MNTMSWQGVGVLGWCPLGRLWWATATVPRRVDGEEALMRIMPMNPTRLKLRYLSHPPWTGGLLATRYATERHPGCSGPQGSERAHLMAYIEKRR
jgi:hypothetical protein